MPELSELLRTKLIPWAQQDAENRFIVAQRKMSKNLLPPSVTLTRCKLSGHRRVVKNHRNYSNVRNIIAKWPDHDLVEVNKYTLVCVVEGHIHYTLGDYKIRCGPGHFIFIPPGIPYPRGLTTYLDLEKSSACKLVTFLLHPGALETWISHGHPEGRQRDEYSLVVHERATTLLQTLMEEATAGEEDAPVITQALLLGFLKILEREVRNGHLQRLRINPPDQKEERTATDSPPADFTARLENYVQSNLRKNLTLERAARDFYLSPAQFSRRVRGATGTSFNRFLAARRFAEAKSLLAHSQWTIAAISELVGFRSTSYFCTFFRQHSGETPSEFRIRLPKNQN